MGSLFTSRNLQRAVQAFLKQGFAQSCCLCHRPANRVVCVDCWRQICACQQFEVLPSNSPHQPMMVWGQYQGSLKRAIAQFKYQNQPDLASLFGEELGLRWLQQYPQLKSFQVIAIPLHRDRLAQRGYNQAELIAKRFSQVVGVPYCHQGLIRTRATEAQHTLSPSERKTNIRGAFAISQSLQQKQRRHSLLLIDDIFTTGITIAEAQTVLEKSRFNVLGTAVIAQALLG